MFLQECNDNVFCCAPALKFLIRQFRNSLSLDVVLPEQKKIWWIRDLLFCVETKS
jgi:hypothetical protein